MGARESSNPGKPAVTISIVTEFKPGSINGIVHHSGNQYHPPIPFSVVSTVFNTLDSSSPVVTERGCLLHQTLSCLVNINSIADRIRSQFIEHRFTCDFGRWANAVQHKIPLGVRRDTPPLFSIE